MSDAQQSDTPDVAPQTLDQTMESFSVEAPTPNNVQEFTPAQPTQLDPYDEGSLNKWASDTAQNQAALQNEIQTLKQEAQSRADAEAARVMEQNVKSAVDVLSKGLEGIDPLMAEFILEKTARENPKFKDLFHNQKGNEDVYNSALQAIITENEGKFARVDPQIAENHRAAKSSTQSNATAKTTEFGNSLEQQLAEAKTPNEQRLIWNRIKNGGY